MLCARLLTFDSLGNVRLRTKTPQKHRQNAAKQTALLIGMWDRYRAASDTVDRPQLPSGRNEGRPSHTCTSPPYSSRRPNYRGRFHRRELDSSAFRPSRCNRRAELFWRIAFGVSNRRSSEPVDWALMARPYWSVFSEARSCDRWYLGFKSITRARSWC